VNRVGWLALVLGCGSAPKGPPPSVDSGASSPVDSAAPVTALPRIVSGPNFISAGPAAPLTQWLELSTDVPCTVSLELEAPDGETLVRAWAGSATEHRLPVLELLADTRFTATVRVQAAFGEAVASGDLTTDPLPFPLPTLQVLAHDPARMQPGLTVMPMQAGELDQWVGVLDAQLRWRHLLQIPAKVNDVRFGDDGDLWLIAGSAVERRAVDGTVHARWHAQADTPESVFVDLVGDFHHEVVPLGDRFLSLARRSASVPDYPFERNATGAGRAAEVLVPLVVEVGLDGTILREVDLARALDVRRIGMDSNNDTEMGLDWGHANAVIPDGPDHWIVSLRHQDAVVRLTRDGEVDWILANHDGWPDRLRPHLLAPVGGFEWPFHQHAPERLADGGIALFDNGNYGHTPYGEPPDTPQRSRLRIVDVDPVARTVTDRWSLDETPATGALFGWAMGDADVLANGNLLGVYGHLAGEAGRTNEAAGRGETHARVLELALDDPEHPVLDLRMSSRRSVVPLGWRVYRAQRIDRLHPSVVR
jgi:arylsulfate sulfotransferase